MILNTRDNADMSSNGFKIRAGPRFPIQGKTGSGKTVPKVNGKPKADGKVHRKLAGSARPTLQ